MQEFIANVFKAGTGSLAVIIPIEDARKEKAKIGSKVRVKFEVI